MIKKSLLLLLTISFLFSYTYAQSGFDENNPSTPYQNAITTAVPFLLISPDARSGGLGDQGVATTPDVNSQAYNAAKYVFCQNMFGFSVSYVPWLKGLVSDINLANLNMYYKPTEMDAIAFSLKYFSMGDIEMTDVYGSPIGNRKPNEYAIDFSYSRKFIEQLSMSVTGRFIYSNLASNIEVGGNDMKAGMAGAADIGLFYQDNFKVSGL